MVGFIGNQRFIGEAGLVQVSVADQGRMSLNLPNRSGQGTYRIQFLR